jgi:hypothetical protein
MVSPVAPAELGSRWALSVRFAIKAASQGEARGIIGQTLASLDRALASCTVDRGFSYSGIGSRSTGWYTARMLPEAAQVRVDSSLSETGGRPVNSGIPSPAISGKMVR